MVVDKGVLVVQGNLRPLYLEVRVELLFTELFLGSPFLSFSLAVSKCFVAVPFAVHL